MNSLRLHEQGRNPFQAGSEAILLVSHRYFNLRVTGVCRIYRIAPVKFDRFAQRDV